MKKTKNRRQNQWNDFIEQQKEKKAAIRRSHSIKLMKNLNIKNDCTACFHHKTQSCTDILPRGCEYFTGDDNLRTLAGIDNFPEITPNNKAEWFQKIISQNPWLRQVESDKSYEQSFIFGKEYTTNPGGSVKI